MVGPSSFNADAAPGGYSLGGGAAVPGAATATAVFVVTTHGASEYSRGSYIFTSMTVDCPFYSVSFVSSVSFSALFVPSLGRQAPLPVPFVDSKVFLPPGGDGAAGAVDDASYVPVPPVGDNIAVVTFVYLFCFWWG